KNNQWKVLEKLHIYSCNCIQQAVFRRGHHADNRPDCQSKEQSQCCYFQCPQETCPKFSNILEHAFPTPKSKWVCTSHYSFIPQSEIIDSSVPSSFHFFTSSST